MWDKIKKWLGLGSSVKADEADITAIAAEDKFKQANEMINMINDQITDAVTTPAKKTKSSSKKTKSKK